jgi:hypothetical protein
VSDATITLYSKTATGNETGTIDIEAAANVLYERAGFMLRIQHASYDIALGITGTFTTIDGSSSIVIPSITTTEPSNMILAFIAIDGADYSTFGYPAGYTNESEIGIGGSNGIGLTFATRQLDTATATGTCTVTQALVDGQVGVLISVHLTPINVDQDVFTQSVYMVGGIAQKDNQAVRIQSTYVITGYGVKDHQSVNEQSVYVITN